MKFLFHTVIMIEKKPVYYNVHQVSEERYYVELLQNTNNVAGAVDFYLTVQDNEWVSSDESFARDGRAIGEDIESFLKNAV
jgi:hypothetical protein